MVPQANAQLAVKLEVYAGYDPAAAENQCHFSIQPHSAPVPKALLENRHSRVPYRLLLRFRIQRASRNAQAV